ncbi:hypothetical protein B0H19DRAFT_535523 [Mycena capillaripes]|nr:hypothetical protein B0H19DRAFT_535523 [Mycena capillaripes]
MAAQFLVLPIGTSSQALQVKAMTFRSTSHRHIQFSRPHGQPNAVLVVFSFILCGTQHHAYRRRHTTAPEYCLSSWTAMQCGVAHEHRHRYEVRLSIVSRHIVVGRVLTVCAQSNLFVSQPLLRAS